jgi:hypothetical protein
LVQGLQAKGFNTPETVRHLGIELGVTMKKILIETLLKIDLKAIKRQILATTSPYTKILYRATLVNSAMIPPLKPSSYATPSYSSSQTNPFHFSGPNQLKVKLSRKDDLLPRNEYQPALAKEVHRYNTPLKQ